jgi:hypothetical protein
MYVRRSRIGIVSITTRLWAGWSGVPIPNRRDFLFSKMLRQALGPTHSPVQWALGFFHGKA